MTLLDPRSIPPMLDTDDIPKRKLEKYYRAPTAELIAYLDFSVSTTGVLSGVKVQWLYHHKLRCILLVHVASSPGSLRVSHWRAWYFFSRYIIVRGQDRSKDCCTSLPFAGDGVSALSLWYRRALKSSCKKCRFTAFLRCLRTAVFAHTKIHPSTTLLPSTSHT